MQIAGQPAALFQHRQPAGLLVQAGVFDGNGSLARQRLHHCQIAIIEGVQSLALGIQDANVKNGKVNGQRIPLTDNSVVEGTLAKFGIASVEDLIHEITTVGARFKEANNFLWPFKLNSPKKGFAAKRHPYQNGGAWGNREELINELVKRML